MLLALAIIMSVSLASRMIFTILKELYNDNPIGAFTTILIDGGLYQTTLWVLYAHT